jgi:hypothetical protein
VVLVADHCQLFCTFGWRDSSAQLQDNSVYASANFEENQQQTLGVVWVISRTMTMMLSPTPSRTTSHLTGSEVKAWSAASMVNNVLKENTLNPLSYKFVERWLCCWIQQRYPQPLGWPTGLCCQRFPRPLGPVSPQRIITFGKKLSTDVAGRRRAVDKGRQQPSVAEAGGGGQEQAWDAMIEVLVTCSVWRVVCGTV